MTPTQKRNGYALLSSVTVFICMIFLFASSGYAAPLAQALLPNFIMRAQTTITVTVSLADGQTVRVPVALDFTTRHEEVGGYLFIDAHAEQQPDLFIAVDDSGTISASMQAIVYSTATPKPVAIAPTLSPPTPTLAPIVVAPTATATQVPPTPSPTSTLAPTIDLVELVFRQEAVRILGDFSDALNWLTQQTTAAQKNSSIILTDEWILQTGGAVAAIRALNNEIRSLEAPPRYAASWAEMRIAADKYDLAMDAFVSGVDNFNVDQINQAGQFMLEGHQAIIRANALFPPN